jgi:hypothetical protein
VAEELGRPPDGFRPPPVDPAVEKAFLERRLLELLERTQFQERRIAALEARIAHLEGFLRMPVVRQILSARRFLKNRLGPSR